MIKLLLTILFFCGFFLVLYIHKRKQSNDRIKDTPETVRVCRVGSNHVKNSKPKSPLLVDNTICNAQPIWFGKSQRQKKTNYLHISKRTKLKHKKQWK